MAWNFNSCMAAIDATLSHLVGYQAIILSSRKIYGGAYQLLHDWFRKPANLDVAVEFFDGYELPAFQSAVEAVRAKHGHRLQAGRQIYVYLESPCNPHGYVLDVPVICRAAHHQGLTVILDATVGPPFLTQPLRRELAAERPDFLIHSYTKDITGSGATTAGVVIARNERMFIPKNDSTTTTDLSGCQVTYHWNETLFWNVFYVKGAFLDSDKTFEVITGSPTLAIRMLRKALSTLGTVGFLARHPPNAVSCQWLDLK